MTQYQRVRKTVRDYLSRQRRAGLTISAKLPAIPKKPTQGSIRRLEKTLESAKKEAKVERARIKREEKEQAKIQQDFMEKPLEDVKQEWEEEIVSPNIDLDTGEMFPGEYRREPDEDFDFYENVISIAIYDNTNSGQPTEFKDRINQFITDAILYYGTDNVAKALMDAQENGVVLTRMEMYNNGPCHDWITEMQSYLKLYDWSDTTNEPLQAKYDALYDEWNEDYYNTQIDTELYQEKYRNSIKFADKLERQRKRNR